MSARGWPQASGSTRRLAITGDLAADTLVDLQVYDDIYDRDRDVLEALNSPYRVELPETG